MQILLVNDAGALGTFGRDLEHLDSGHFPMVVPIISNTAKVEEILKGKKFDFVFLDYEDFIEGISDAMILAAKYPEATFVLVTKETVINIPLNLLIFEEKTDAFIHIRQAKQLNQKMTF